MLSGIAIAGLTISRDIVVDKTTKDTYTEMGIASVTTSAMDSYGNVKVFNKGVDLFQVNVPLTYCSNFQQRVWSKDEMGFEYISQHASCLEYSNYTTAELENMIVAEVNKGLEKLRVGYVEKKAEGTKPSLIDGGIITIRQR